MQLCLIRRNAANMALLVIPMMCLSMGGCPPTGGGNPVCGNGTTETGEQCDDGNTTSGDGCSATCQTEAACGDGTVDTGEQCDDGNTDNNDGCSSTCQNEEDTEPSPADDDGDGVRNEIDECPGTRRGTEVNEVGCPTDVPADDSDSDGVVGDADDCPNTPANAPVDENGCAASQRDTDGDGVTDNIDTCELTPSNVEVDAQGCPVSTDPTDDDADGVPNDIDQCPNTAANATGVDPNGCAPSQRDSDGDGVTNDVDQCDDQPGPASNGGCPGGGGGPICGNGGVEAGEQCDDGNTVNGDGCSSTCQTESNSGIANDNCSNPTAIGEGTLIYSNIGATTDGPEEPVDCNFFGNGNIRSDLWYCYTATCTGEADFSLCGSGYDTKLAVYAGCACPDPGPEGRPLACSDDDCGSGVENIQSRVSVNVTAGQSYLVRVGGFAGTREQGDGRLTIRCGQDTCVNGTGSCTTAHGDNQPGCDTESCCNAVCEVDTFCCDVNWDAFCASQATGFCNPDGFSSCNSRAGSCATAGTSPGCNDSTCCNAVCATDPFCCLTEWDGNCSAAGIYCASCGSRHGSCDSVQSTGGCDDTQCCIRVCVADGFCCTTAWDASCVEKASEICGP